MSHTRYTNSDPQQGSMFMETVVYPTLAPDLARDYHLPGTEGHRQAVAQRVQTRDSNALPDPASPGANVGENTGSASTSTNTAQGDDDEVSGDEGSGPGFFVQVFLSRIVQVIVDRKPKRKTEVENKMVGQKLPLLSMGRCDFVKAALGAYGYQNVFSPDTRGGPIIQLSYPGVPGGQAKAPFIFHDADWDIFKARLEEKHRTTKGKLDSIFVNMKLSDLEHYRTHGQIGGLYPDQAPGAPVTVQMNNSGNIMSVHSVIGAPGGIIGQTSFGTHVPTLESFTEGEREHGTIMAEIKAAHPCEKHNGSGCFIVGKDDHIPLNRLRLSSWAAAVAAKECTTSAPPQALLDAWSGGALPTAPARGRSGPSRTPVASSSANAEATNLLIATMVPMVAMASQTMAKTLKRQSRALDSSPPSSPVQGSSDRSPSPSSVHRNQPGMDLRAFLEAFCSAQGLDGDVLERVFVSLNEVDYTPGLLGEPTVRVDRIQELTGLSEGHTHALFKYARESRRRDQKRARLSRHRR